VKRWALIAGLVVAALAAAQSSTAVQFIQRAVLDLTRGGTVGGDLAVNGDAGVTGAVSIGGTMTSARVVATATSTQYACTGAGACSMASASGQNMAVDCGGGTCSATLGATNATTSTVGRSGQTTTINGTTTVGGTLSTGANNITTTARYCTDVACTTAYMANDTFGTLNLIGSVGGSGNWSTAGSFNSDTSLKIGATAVGTCNSGAEGVMRRDSAGGGTTGHRTKVCLCTSDGAGTPAYAWTNLGSGTVGTSTACND